MNPREQCEVRLAYQFLRYFCVVLPESRSPFCNQHDKGIKFAAVLPEQLPHNESM